MIKLTGIHFYPLKSARGIAPETWMVGAHGLEFDRRWMLVDEKGRFVTQREQPRLTLVGTALSADKKTLTLSHAGDVDLVIPVNGHEGETRTVQVWDDQVQGLRVGADADAWFSDYLGVPLQLVEYPQSQLRQVDTRFAQAGEGTAFSDGFPLLLISEASLKDLNDRLETPVPMRRFRPNLVVSGTESFAEDLWARIRIGDVTFRVAKPCPRCVITTINPDSAEKGREPLRTLSTYRHQDNKIMFGQNLIQDGGGELSLGDSVEILEWRDSGVVR